MTRPNISLSTPSVRVRVSAAALLAAAAGLSACATSNFAPREGYTPPPARELPRPNFPISAAPAAPAAADAPQATAQPTPPAADEAPAPTARPSGAISSQPLTAPAAAPVQSQELPPPPPPPPPAPVSAAPASPQVSYAPPPPVTTTTVVTSVNGRVVDVSGRPESYTIKSGDTLTSIARRMGTTQKALADDNNLEPPYTLRPGRVLKGPVTKAKAYVVGQGDTLFSIARRFSVTPAAVARANDMDVGDAIRSGQRLELPAGFKDSGPIRRTVTTTAPAASPATTTVAAASPPPSAPVIAPSTAAPRPVPPATTTTTTTVAAAPPPARPAAAPPAATTTTTTTTTVAAAPPPPRPTASTVVPTTPATAPLAQRTVPPAPALPTSATVLSDAEIAAAGRGRFLWPARGPVIAGYGPKAGNQRNEGLDLRIAAGEPVKAAAAGEVVYAGDQVPGFGNLVLVKHEGGWVTAYAHLSRTDVKMRQTVAQGQQLGQVGQSGGVDEPQLHFEVRYAPSARDLARSIDPALVLPH